MIGVQWRARDSKQTAVSGQGGVWNGVDLTQNAVAQHSVSFAFYKFCAERCYSGLAVWTRPCP